MRKTWKEMSPEEIRLYWQRLGLRLALTLWLVTLLAAIYAYLR